MSTAAQTYDWNAEAIAKLRGLWDEGHPTAEIGRRLGVSKSAVIGKVHRLRLPGRPSPIIQAAPTESRPRPKRAPIPNLAEMMSIQVCGHAAGQPGAPTNGEPGAAPLSLPVRSKTIARTCCWPIGDPGTRGFRFCDTSAILGKPYCEDHAKVAYMSRRYRNEPPHSGAQSD